MDRRRRGSVAGAETKRKGKSSDGGGGFGQMVGPQIDQNSGKFGGSMVAPSLRENDESLLIDPNLLVGPLYVPKVNRQDAIKEQLGDITAKLHNTLYAFDEFEDFEHGEDPLLGIVRKQIGDLEDPDMKHNLAHIMDRFEDMSMQVSEANRERDDMLLQLADWFTTDHVDLEDIKTSIDETEEESIKQGYFDTVTNFEKLKKLQSTIMTRSGEGKSTRQLEMKKVELERDVVDKFKVMKDMSMQTMKLKVSDDAPWKYAAQEIVSMLRNVRTENADELQAIHKKMQDMIDQLEKQALMIKALKAELKEKKEVCKKFADENGDLSQDVALFRARTNRYERELDQAKQMLRSLNQEKLDDKDAAEYALSQAQGKSLSESISKVLSKLEDKPGEVKRYTSDPALLRTQLREYKDALECIRGEYSRSAEEVEELTTELEEKREYISNMENDNDKLTRDIRKLRQERRQSIAVGALIPPPGEGHQCEHCKCHIPEKDPDEEIDELKAEVLKWQDKCNYFKKCLADTEMKLSGAFKEISDLRMERDLPPPPPPQAPPKSEEKKTKPPTPKPKKIKEAPASAPAPAPPARKPDKPEEKDRKSPKPKPKREVKARYMQQPSRQTERQRLPPIERQQPIEEKIEEQLESSLTPKQNRELKLYKVGDLQGMLNMLVSEIMEFVADIGKMLYKEKDDEKGKIQSMKAFAFDNNSKKEKEVRDPKEEEAKMKKSQVIFNGQHACAKLREAFESLSSSMELQHNEYEAIYRSFKVSQQRNTIRREVILGKMPVTALADFDKQQYQKMRDSGQENLLSVYYNISYGGSTGLGVANKPRRTGSLQRRTSSVYSVQSETSDTNLKNTMHVLAIHKSTSDLDVRDPHNSIIGSLAATGLFGERQQILLANTQDPGRFRETTGQPNKQEVKMGVAVVPRKGAIGIQTTDDEILYEAQQLPMNVHGERKQSITSDTDHKGKRRSLIRRNDILEHIKLGNKLLEESEEIKQKEEEITRSLGDYTILDLQSKILEMTDSKSMKRQQTPPTMKEGHLQPPPKRHGPAADKSVTLPSIKNLNPFKM